MFAKSGDQGTRKSQGRRAAQRPTFLRAMWKNGVVRSTVGVGATSALIATMMFGGGGFSPALASPTDQKDSGVEQQMLKAVEDGLKTAASESPSADADVPAPKTKTEKTAKSVQTPLVAPASASVDTKPTTTNQAQSPVAKVPATKAAVEAKTPSAPVMESPKLAEPKALVQAEAPVVAAAGVPGVCDTNVGTGKVSTFMQRSDTTQFANGNLSEGLYEGGYVHQRVQFSNLQMGENEFVFRYQVRQAGLWAYDFIDQYSMTGGTITSTPQVIEGSGSDRVDQVKLTFNATSPNATLYFSAHISSELDHGPGTGASSINGSPYHVMLSTLNCAQTGSMDNQIKAQDVQVGFVTIIKSATPADGTDFNFTLSSEKTGGSVDFQLDDSRDSDTGAVLPNSMKYTVAPGVVSISENDLPAGWNLTDLTCTGVTPAVDKSKRIVSFTLLNRANVACTFTNSKTTYKDLAVSKTAVAKFDRDYDWTIDKNLAPGQDSSVKSPTADVAVDYSVLVTASAAKDSNFVVDGVITVDNNNPVAMSGVTLTDTLPGATCSISTPSGTPVNGPISVPAGTSSYNYSCQMPAGTTPTSAGTNTVKATWEASSYFGTDGEATATKNYTFVGVTPTITDDQVTVTDKHFDLSALAGGNIVKAEESPKTFNYTVTWPGVAGDCTTYDNTATYTEADGGTGSDSASVEVCLGANLTIKKDAAGTFNRDYDWTIDKTPLKDGQPVDDKTEYTADENGVVSVDYKVTVAPADPAYVDSAWSLTGTITVTNPNDWQDIPATVTDTVGVGEGGVCTIKSDNAPGSGLDDDADTAGYQKVIPKSGEVKFSYECSFDSVTDYTGSNTAKVEWDQASASTSNGFSEFEKPITADTWVEKSTNKTITVTDDHHDFVPAWEITWAEGLAAQDKTYTLEWQIPEGKKCDDFTNIATIKSTDGFAASDSAIITACLPGKLVTAKTSDPVSGSYVAPDSTVKYTLSFTNSGGTEIAVDHVDHLADVLDDAEINDDLTVNGNGLTATLDGDQINITGMVQPGETVTVTYSVKIKTEKFGDGIATNFLIPGGETPPEVCDPEVVDCTTHPILGSATWVKVDPKGKALVGSEWELTGPGITQPQKVEDCIAKNAADCTGLDRNPAAGKFELGGLKWGEYSLKETKAPAGYILDSKARPFTIGNAEGASIVIALGNIENLQQPGLDLPLTGGVGSQTFFIGGGAVLLAALALLGWRRRKEVA